MAGICLTATRSNGGAGGHLTVSVDLDGTTITLPPSAAHYDTEFGTALESFEQTQLIVLLLRYLKTVKGLDLAALAGRVVLGEEATNVKEYVFFGPGDAITKTNIGTSYVNICPGANGERILADFTGCTQFRLFMTANLVGSGAFGLRAVRDGDNSVLFENASIALTGERELDSDWQSVPQGFSGLTLLRVQGKSATAADDPVFRRCTLLLK